MPGPRTMWGYCRGSLEKHQCAAFDRSLAGPVDLPVTRNGAVMTGTQPDGRILTVIDLDVEAGDPPLPLEALDPLSRSTYVVRSGKGGLHVYFYTDAELPNAKGIESARPHVRQVDRRGSNGIVFAPGCAFKDHAFTPYAVALDQPIRSITVDEFWRVWDLYGKTRYEERAKDPEKRATQRHEATIRKARAAGKRDVPPAPRVLATDDAAAYPMFPPCVSVLMSLCARGEHLYHDERVFLASFMNAAGLDPEGAIEPLFVHMPDYSATKTHNQVAGIVAKGYKPMGCHRLKASNMCPGDCRCCEG